MNTVQTACFIYRFDVNPQYPTGFNVATSCKDVNNPTSSWNRLDNSKYNLKVQTNHIMTLTVQNAVVIIFKIVNYFH